MKILEYLMIREHDITVAWIGILMALFAFVATKEPNQLMTGYWIGILSMPFIPEFTKKIGPEDKDIPELLALAQTVRNGHKVYK